MHAQQFQNRFQLKGTFVSKTQDISKMNDLFRTTMIETPNHRVVLTSGVADGDDETAQEVITAVRAFNDFTDENDPHGEHDFGKCEVRGETYFWKIDYFDRDSKWEYGADPYAGPVARSLTIMRADEY